jgi:hypothetical protein
MNQRAILRGIGITTASLVAAYGVYAGVTWLGYGRRHSAKKEEADPLLDRFMAEYEVAERHRIYVQAPAEVTLTAAFEMDFNESRIVRTIFKGRELLLHGHPPEMSCLEASCPNEGPGVESTGRSPRPRDSDGCGNPALGRKCGISLILPG